MTMQTIAPAHDQIAALAHKFWEDEGRPEGRADHHWLRAISTLSAPASKPAAQKPATKKAAKAKG
jgi:hypothetical protein